MSRIYLIGYMGAGKTTLGAPLSVALGYSFIDLDIFIENRYHKTINELFAIYGESEFRNIERKALLEVSTIENAVISTGGGTPCYFDNMDVMNKTGLTIYLDVSQNRLFKRLKQGKWKRPKLKDKSDSELKEFITQGLSDRLKYYNQAQLVHSGEELETVETIHDTVDHLIVKVNSIV